MKNFKNLTSLKLLASFLVFIIYSNDSFGQYSIEGPTAANLLDVEEYKVVDSNGYPPVDFYTYSWNINGGVITKVNKRGAGLIPVNDIAFYTGDDIISVFVKWDTPGNFNDIYVEIYNDDQTVFFYPDLSVEVLGEYPNTPDTSILNNNNVCTPMVTRTGTPQNGEIWYWQGKAPYGTSITKGAGVAYYPNEGSGTYYLRTKDINGFWSVNSKSFEISIISETLWYADTDGDGFGDPASNPISSCSQPAGRVSNNFDQCPTVSGNLLNNGCSGNGDSGSTDKNYVHTVTPLIAVNDISEITNEDDKLESVTYFDGLGRPIQNVAIRAGGQKQDIKTPLIYDEFGRRTKTYLPHAIVTSSSLNYTDNTTLINDLNTYYSSKYTNQLNSSNPNAYREQRFDDSPLNRVQENGTPGEDWRIDPNGDSDHTTKYAFGANVTNEVYNIDYPGEGQPLSLSNYYVEGQLLKNTVKNANWQPSDNKINTKDIFTDKSGKKIAEFDYIVEDSVLKVIKTYYVYDNVGNLVYVLAPKIFSIINDTTISVANLLTLRKK